jgi:uncharacterized protein (DUF2062 family)
MHHAAMPRKLFRKYLPSHASIRGSRHFARFGALLDHPNLWHLNRRSVAGGVAIGMFAGLVPGPIQMLCAGLLAIPLRVNLPVAMATTWYTNPLTIGPLYLIAYEIGQPFAKNGGPPDPAPELDLSHFWQWTEAFVLWVLGLGQPLVLGLGMLALALALLGWIAVWFGWRWYVVNAWRRRSKRRTPAVKGG